MDGESVKNDIKTTFLIANTFNAMVGGLFPLSLATGLMLSEAQGLPAPVAFCLGFGTPMSTVAALGYYAAFKDNKKMLHTYAAILGFLSALEVAGVVATTLPSDYFDEAITIFSIVHIGIALAAVALAVALAKRPGRDLHGGPEKSSRGTRFLQYLGYVAIVVFIYLLFIYFS